MILIGKPCGWFQYKTLNVRFMSIIDKATLDNIVTFTTNSAQKKGGYWSSVKFSYSSVSWKAMLHLLSRMKPGCMFLCGKTSVDPDWSFVRQICSGMQCGEPNKNKAVAWLEMTLGPHQLIRQNQRPHHRTIYICSCFTAVSLNALESVKCYELWIPENGPGNSVHQILLACIYQIRKCIIKLYR